MIKKFNELVKLDLTKFTQKKPTFFKGQDGRLKPTSEDKWLDYIEWAKLLELLYENGADEVGFFSEIHKEKINTLVIHLCIDSQEYVTDYPIIDGNSVITAPNQMQLHKAELRGFVKCVAIHTGLGLSLWMREERQMQEVVNHEPKKEEPKKGLPEMDDETYTRCVESIKDGKLTQLTPVVKKYSLTQEQHEELFNLLNSIKQC